MAKAAFNRMKTLVTKKLDLKFKVGTSEVLQLKRSILWC
jgi:hypothetical protein